MSGTGTAVGQPDNYHADAETLIRRWFDEVWNKGMAQSIDELFPETSVMWGINRPQDRSQGPAEFKKFYHQLRSAFSNINFALDQVVQQDDTAFARWTATMTHAGEGLPVPASNAKLTIAGMSAIKVLDGIIVEGWNVWDQIGMARQLGTLEGLPTQIFP